MQYTITAHPTTYNGVNFRSRLEAQWAAYFDLLKISWDYEPVDLKGWTPDFSLKILGYDNVFVEVKPFYDEATFRRIVAHCGNVPCVLAVAKGCLYLCSLEEGEPFWTENLCNKPSLWCEAGNRVQWRPNAYR